MSTASEPVTLGEIAHGGYCVARTAEGKVVFVRHGLPGEVVTLRYLEERPRLAFAEVEQVLTPSPDRVAAPHPGSVGGAELAHVSYPAQVEWKRAAIQQAFRSVAGEEIAASAAELLEMTPHPLALSGRLDLRTRVEFTVTEAGRLGMFPYRSRDLQEVDAMPLASPKLAALRLFDAPSPWNFQPGTRVRAVAPQVGAPVLSDGKTVWAAPGERAAGREVQEQVAWQGQTLTYRVDADSFWQAAVGADQLLVDAVVPQVEAGEDVVELFAGSGLLSVPLALQAGKGRRFTSLEGVSRAVRAGRNNLRAAGVESEVEVGRAKITPQLIRGLGEKLHAAQLVADPPRAGLGLAAVKAICETRPSRIAMVFCDASAAARDLKAFLQAGYQLRLLRGIDLFPGTSHVEIVAILN